MISRIKGTLLSSTTERVEVETASGLVYEVEIPLTVHQRMPAVGSEVELRTLYVVREDAATLFGFIDAGERELFSRLLTASGVGAKVALAMLSTYTARRLAQALAEKDVTALQQVSGIGRKKAEMIVLALADKVAELAVSLAGVEGGAGGAESAAGSVQAAVAALVALGFSFADADAAVRGALAEGEADSTDELVRRALRSR